jgi:hypothetical protein
MKTKQKISRYKLACRLQSLALQIAAGKPIRVGSTSICIPPHVVIEEEIDITNSGTELEFEIHWPATKSRALASKKPSRVKRRSSTGS